jgi:hypothetical protein
VRVAEFDVRAALDAVEVARAPRMRHRRRGPTELLASSPLQRLIPDSLALEFGARFAVRRLLADPGRDATLASYARFLDGTPRAGEGPAVALRASALAGRATVAIERPWLLRRVRHSGAEHVLGALEQGRGVLLTTLHSTAMWVGQYADTLHRYSRYSVSGSWLDAEPLAAHAWRHRDRLERLGCRFVPATSGSYGVLAELLRRGRGCGIAFGLPGTTPVRFMGKAARLRSGVARLAFDTGAPVCPGYADFGGARVTWHHLPVLYARDFEDPPALLQALATTFERVLVDHPELWQPHDPGDPLGSADRVWAER